MRAVRYFYVNYDELEMWKENRKSQQNCLSSTKVVLEVLSQ